MADDQDEQRPGDRRMETAQTGHPRNLAALGDQLDTESRPAMTAAQHGEDAGDRHQRHAHIEEGMADPDQEGRGRVLFRAAAFLSHRPDGSRSEEHTSELQSLMRISY